MIRLGVIGYGYWGPNLVRNFVQTDGCAVAAVSDRKMERLSQVHRLYPKVTLSASGEDVIADKTIDAVAVATPVGSHFALAMKALKAGKHVLVEKPMAETSDQCKRLIDEAAKRRKVLMVDHTFAYTGAVRKIRELVSSGKIGRPYYYDSVRVNLGLFQHDVNVLWDLAVHDLAILDYALGVESEAVSATGVAHVKKGMEDIAYLTCFFRGKLIANLHVNWLAPVKIRRTLIGGDKKMIVYDDLAADEKLKVYDKGVDGAYQQLVNYRTGDMWAPKLDRTEALRVEAAHFVDCMTKGKKPLTDGRMGLRIVKVLEAADKSLKAGGARKKVA